MSKNCDKKQAAQLFFCSDLRQKKTRRKKNTIKVTELDVNKYIN